MCKLECFLQHNRAGGWEFTIKKLISENLKLQVIYRVIYVINPSYYSILSRCITHKS